MWYHDAVKPAGDLLAANRAANPRSIHAMKHTTFTSLLSVAALALAMDAEATMVVGDANTTTVVTPTDTIITATQNATLTVTEPGEIEILLVGGGGGAGGSTEKASGYTSSDSRGGGGGGGGVIHKTGFHVGVGTYFITVGAGGAVNRSNDTIGSATGGNTTGFGLTALGGGPGGCVDPTTYYNSSALAGASGGGGSKNSNGRSYPGGSALASAENENMGHAGGNALDYKTAGGGGGAGTAGTTGSPVGGNGYACDISGTSVYYGGGGGGGRRDSSAVAQPGLGGGKNSYGGGGTGQIGWSTPEAGGPGIAIVRFTRTAQKTSSNFEASGYDAMLRLENRYACLVITNDTTLHVTGSVSFDMLLVGGGGGAGANSSNQTDYRGGGGGGGGVIHLRNVPVAAGDYPITVGPGGAVNTGAADTTVNGGDTTAFGFTAFGGGPGAPATGYGATIGNIGASGGGGATDGGTTVGRGIIYAGTAKASAANLNLGHDGADAYTNGTAGPKYNGGGGGGAGGAAINGVGGDGYLCDITDTAVYYGGGGAGGKRYNSGDVAKPGLVGGTASWGGGGSGQYGNSNAADGFNTTPQPGGRGIVILRYLRPELAFVLVVR